MKKILSILLIASVFLTMGQICYADDTGIMIIGGNDGEAQTVNLDDFKVGDTAEIDGYGEVCLSFTDWCNRIGKYSSSTYYYYGWGGEDYYEADSEAKYLLLWVHILNTGKASHDFYKDFNEIICTYDDEYQFGGWVRQFVEIKDNGESMLVLNNTEGSTPVGMLYSSNYGVVITLPLAVYNGVTKEGKPLTVSFKLGENEFTYIWRDR